MSIWKQFCHRFSIALLPVLCVLAGSGASAQAYPSKSIRLIVGAPPGGGSDFVARILAQQLSSSFGQAVVIDNRGGAAGNIAADLTAKAPPDGYTLIIVSNSHASSVNLYSKLPYDPVKDFAPITY